MPDFTNIISSKEDSGDLEKKLHLKQLQINRLLQLTQSINDNISVNDLYESYTSFLTWELNVQKLALFFREDDRWIPVAHYAIDEDLLALDLSDLLPRFRRLSRLEEEPHALLREFQVVIPVSHKDLPLAYSFIGGMGEDEDFYNKIQFITAITNIVAVAVENKRLFKQQLEREALNREMQLARDMQRMMIPEKLPDGKNGYEMAGIYRPKLSVGGDYYDYFEKEEGRFAFCVGDVTGKGVAAALLVANFQAVFHGLFEQNLEIEMFIRAFNRAIFRLTRGDKFFTYFVAEYDPYTQLLRYVNAGHNPPALVLNGRVQRLTKGCTILGTVPELPHLEVGEVHITDEAVLFTYTDGLTDIKNPDGHFLDDDFIQEFCQDHYRLSAKNFNTYLLREIETFTRGMGYPDDLTVLTCKIY